MDINSFEASDENDPAADFIARERVVLEDDYGLNNGHSNDYGNVNGVNSYVEENDAMDGPIKGIKDMTLNQSTSSISSTRTEEKEEPEKIRKWREQQTRLLEEKDAEEAKRKVELREQAKKELEEWYLRYSEQLEKSKLNNRNAEKEWIAERDSETPGQEWEKITKMCDFNPKSSRNTRDTTRMRSILLQLKQSPPNSSQKS